VPAPHRLGTEAHDVEVHGAGSPARPPLAPPLGVVVDRDRFKRALTNILDNALRYTPSNGHVRVTAKVVFTPSGGTPITKSKPIVLVKQR